MKSRVKPGWNVFNVSEFCHFSQEWQDIVTEVYHSHPFLQLEFVEPLIRYFSDGNLFLAVEESDGVVVSMALLQKSSWTTWQTFCPSQAPIAYFVTRHDTLMAGVGLFDVLSRYTQILEVYHYDNKYFPPIGLRKEYVEEIKHANTMEVEVAGDFDNYWGCRSKNLRKNISRRLRRLDMDGINYRISVISKEDDMRNGVAVYGDIESSGWKGRSGSAIHADNLQGKFYTDVLEGFAKRGDARIINLHFNEQIVASRLAIISNRCMIILKTTYNENYAQYGPGRILLYMLLKEIFSGEDIDSIEFYTNANSDQLQWCTSHRMIYHINIYRSVLMNRLVLVRRRIQKLFNNSNQAKSESGKQ